MSGPAQFPVRCLRAVRLANGTLCLPTTQAQVSGIEAIELIRGGSARLVNEADLPALINTMPVESGSSRPRLQVRS